MEIAGRVQNGVVVLEGSPELPEGAKVTVLYHAPMEAEPQPEKRWIDVPRGGGLLGRRRRQDERSIRGRPFGTRRRGSAY